MKRMWSKNELRKIIQETYGIDINNLIDKDGHERFIEGDIEIEEITGVTKTFGKWSLSGSHLLIVVAIQVEDATAIVNGTTLANLNLPNWIKEKIVVLFASNVVDRKNFAMFDDSYTSQTLTAYLDKVGDVVRIDMGNITLTSTKKVRIAYDLLIDNE